MSDKDESPGDQRDPLPDPAVIAMIADGLDERANTLQKEARRLSDDAEQLREIAQKLRDG